MTFPWVEDNYSYERSYSYEQNSLCKNLLTNFIVNLPFMSTYVVILWLTNPVKTKRLYFTYGIIAYRAVNTPPRYCFLDHAFF
jgi:hypothetical protein